MNATYLPLYPRRKVMWGSEEIPLEPEPLLAARILPERLAEYETGKKEPTLEVPTSQGPVYFTRTRLLEILLLMN